jgi:hypothetical protein
VRRALRGGGGAMTPTTGGDARSAD